MARSPSPTPGCFSRTSKPTKETPQADPSTASAPFPSLAGSAPSSLRPSSSSNHHLEDDLHGCCHPEIHQVKGHFEDEDLPTVFKPEVSRPTPAPSPLLSQGLTVLLSSFSLGSKNNPINHRFLRQTPSRTLPLHQRQSRARVQGIQGSHTSHRLPREGRIRGREKLGRNGDSLQGYICLEGGRLEGEDLWIKLGVRRFACETSRRVTSAPLARLRLSLN